MNKRTVARAAAGAALAIAGSLLAAPAPAQAAYACQNGQICVYSDYDLKGTVLVVYSGQHNFTSNWKFFNGLPVNDNASSIINKSGRYAHVWTDFDARGAYSIIDPGTSMNFKGRDLLEEIPNDSMSYIAVY